jgi:hypothetical protein
MEKEMTSLGELLEAGVWQLLDKKEVEIQLINSVTFPFLMTLESLSLTGTMSSVKLGTPLKANGTFSILLTPNKKKPS